MSPLDEQLSRYLDGDLPPRDAAALEARIDREPPVAAALEDLRAVRDALRSLPTEATPPPLRPPSDTPDADASPWRYALPLIPWALAAAAVLLLLLRPTPPAVVTLTAGTTELAGDLRIAAGDVHIDLDGRARIRVIPMEPPPGVLRPAEAEDPMNVRLPLAALAGAAVTVAVIEGTALVTGADADTGHLVTSGAAATFGPGGAAIDAPPPRGTTEDAPAARATALRTRIAQLEGELQSTREELAAQSFTAELAAGQLAQLQGSPSAWPEDVPESMTPERFEEELATRIAELEGVEIDHVDCTEYPCIAAMRLIDGAEVGGWEDEGNPVRAWIEGTLGSGSNVSVNTSRFRHDDYEARFVLFSARGGEHDSDVGVRTKYRMDAMVEELGQLTTAEAEQASAGGAP